MLIFYIGWWNCKFSSLLFLLLSVFFSISFNFPQIRSWNNNFRQSWIWKWKSWISDWHCISSRIKSKIKAQYKETVCFRRKSCSRIVKIGNSSLQVQTLPLFFLSLPSFLFLFLILFLVTVEQQKKQKTVLLKILYLHQWKFKKWKQLVDLLLKLLNVVQNSTTFSPLNQVKGNQSSSLLSSLLCFFCSDFDVVMKEWNEFKLWDF